MKKIFTLGLVLCCGGWLSAQHSVTFQVDMNAVTVSSNGVHIAGDFQDEAGFSSDWDPAATTLTDGNNDGIYDVTVTIPAGRYEYKFLNDNGWGGVESVPAVAQVEEGNGNDNRYLWITQDTTLPAIEIGGAAPAGMSFIKLKADFRNQLSTTSVPDMMGSFNGWSTETPLFDPEGDSIYYNYVYAVAGTYEFKFRDTTDWCCAENVSDTACGAGNGNRELVVGADVIEGPHCYGQCGPCQAGPMIDTVMVTFQVDMTNEKVCNLPDSVDVAGTFTGWGATQIVMTDANNDDVWEVTIPLPNNTNHEYKFRNLLGGNTKWEASANRVLNFTHSNDTIVPIVCFEETGACTGTQYGPANVTFTVDMTQEVPADTIWLIGSFTNPQWQDGRIALTPSSVGAGLFETTVSICPNTFQYKFANGDPTNANNTEFEGDTAVPCAVANGLGGWNREVTRTSANDTTLPYFIYSTCDISAVGVNELNNGPQFAVYPNPFDGFTTVEFEDASNKYNIFVSDVTGKSVKQVLGFTGSRVIISGEDLNSGIYFLTVSNEAGEKKVAKLVVR